MASSSTISIQLVADSVVGCDSGLTIYTREGPIAREDEESDADVACDVFATTSELKQLLTVEVEHSEALYPNTAEFELSASPEQCFLQQHLVV
jgi:hypothetical protein